ncbi:MAG: hypothetical protein Q9M92_01325 [Enterobacterales bacterium]|nr:hypothetical protein [Enterobacterales bacterium]
MAMRLVACFVFCFLLNACSAIPMSSLIKLTSLDSSDLLRLNPAEIRLRVSLVEPYQLVAHKVHLILSF